MRRLLATMGFLAFLHIGAFTGQVIGEMTYMAVFDFKNQTQHEEIGRQLAEMARVIIPEFKGFEVIDRGIIETAIAEKGMDINEVTDSGMGFTSARLVDSDYFIVGNIGMLGTMYSLNIKLIDSENGSVIKAEGLEFESLLRVRKLMSGLLSKILGYGRVTGKPVLDEVEFETMKKDSSIALNISVGSTIVQAAALGAALIVPEEDDPTHLLASLAMIIPPLTPIYTEDWALAPFTIGFSVGSGVFNFVGRSLIEKAGDDPFRSTFGVVLVALSGAAKIYSVINDVVSSTASVEKYNDSIRSQYFISSINFQTYPVVTEEYVGLGLLAKF